MYDVAGMCDVLNEWLAKNPCIAYAYAMKKINRMKSRKCVNKRLLQLMQIAASDGFTTSIIS